MDENRYPKGLLLIVATALALIPALAWAGHDTSSVGSYTGCLGDRSGTFYNLMEATDPSGPCREGDTQVHLSSGDITSVSPGTGLTGGATEGAASLAVDTGVMQTRVAGTCAIGSSIREISADGEVICEPNDVGAVTGLANYCEILAEHTPYAPCTTYYKGAVDTRDQFGYQVGSFSSVAIGADELPLIAYSGGYANDLKVARCNDKACAGGDETITSVDAVARGYPISAVIGADGLPIIAYSGPDMELKVAHCNDVGCTGGNETISSVDTNAGSVSAVVGVDGFPIIAYRDIIDGHLKVTHCNDIACTGGDEAISSVDTASLVVRETSVVISVDGLPIIAYHDRTKEALMVAHCNDVACTGGDETITTVDKASAEVGRDPSMIIGVDGLPVISYYDHSNKDLKVAHCNDVACTGGDEAITAVDTAGEVGSDPSIALGTDGFPTIAYYDSSNEDLKLARCNDVACAEGDETITTVDATGYVGFNPSLAIGVDGLPVISYGDGSAKDLKVARRSVQ